MSPLFLTLAIVHGWASHYSEHVMSEVVHNRTGGGHHIQLDLPPLYHPIAVANCGRLGEHVRLRYDGGPWEMATVVDCANPLDGTAEWMEQNRVLLEMSYQRAVELDTVGRAVPVDVVQWGISDTCVNGPCLVVR